MSIFEDAARRGIVRKAIRIADVITEEHRGNGEVAVAFHEYKKRIMSLVPSFKEECGPPQKEEVASIVVLPEGLRVCANNLAAEDGVKLEELIRRLIEKEDRTRHIQHPPFMGEIRVKCSKRRCMESKERLLTGEEL